MVFIIGRGVLFVNGVLAVVTAILRLYCAIFARDILADPYLCLFDLYYAFQYNEGIVNIRYTLRRP